MTAGITSVRPLGGWCRPCLVLVVLLVVVLVVVVLGARSSTKIGQVSPKPAAPPTPRANRHSRPPPRPLVALPSPFVLPGAPRPLAPDGRPRQVSEFSCCGESTALATGRKGGTCTDSSRGRQQQAGGRHGRVRAVGAPLLLSPLHARSPNKEMRPVIFLNLAPGRAVLTVVSLWCPSSLSSSTGVVHPAAPSGGPHALQSGFTFWYLNKKKATAGEQSYEDNIKKIATFHTVRRTTQERNAPGRACGAALPGHSLACLRSSLSLEMMRELLG